jgi:hypothetical protein
LRSTERDPLPPPTKRGSATGISARISRNTVAVLLLGYCISQRHERISANKSDESGTSSRLIEKKIASFTFTKPEFESLPVPTIPNNFRCVFFPRMKAGRNCAQQERGSSLVPHLFHTVPYSYTTAMSQHARAHARTHHLLRIHLFSNRCSNFDSRNIEHTGLLMANLLSGRQ